ncbi:MAG: hypothetical protein GDA52_05710 [Rhodobacteraceae bacterium]|nr:hypothetical protein [Paracoccaceae bacterium]
MDLPDANLPEGIPTDLSDVLSNVLLSPDVLLSDNVLRLARPTRSAIERSLARARVAEKAATVVVAVGSPAAIKAAAAGIATKVSLAVAAKASIKGVAKGAGLLGGAGIGAAAGSWLGPPGAVVGGLIGAWTALFGVDMAVVRIDAYFNRDEFEAELREMVDEHRREVRAHLIQAVNRKAEDMKSFTLQERSGT